MKRGIVFILLALCTSARGGLPTAGYVSDYYYRNCANAELDVPGAGRSELTAQKYILSIIDILNDGATTYGPDAATNYVVSTGYLGDTLDMLAESRICCLGGYMDIPTARCKTCGEWLITDDENLCLGAGLYYKNGACASCGDGYICAAGTSNRVPCGAGYYCVGNVRTKCEYGTRHCPGATQTKPTDTLGCNNTLVFSE